MTIYDTLHDLLEYRDENLYWKERPSRNVDISKPAGTINDRGYRVIRIKGNNYKAHRLIYLMFNEQWDITDNSRDNSVDHADNDPSNNDIVVYPIQYRPAPSPRPIFYFPPHRFTRK